MKETKNQENNITAALTYLIGPLTGIFFFLVEKDDKFVRFHAFQSILFGIAMVGVNIVLTMFYIPLITNLLNGLVSLGSFILWVLLMWKAYNKEAYELPYLGKIAKEQIYKK